MKSALLVIDVQNACVTDKLYNKNTIINELGEMIAFCRENSVEIIYVRHDDGVGTQLEHGSQGWQIHSDIAPADGEKIFDKKVNSAFRDSGLKEYLNKQSIDTLVMVGLQTEYCIDANIKAGFEHGFDIYVPANSFSTSDNGNFTALQLNEFFSLTIWNNRYAKVRCSDEIMNIILNTLNAE